MRRTSFFSRLYFFVLLNWSWFANRFIIFLWFACALNTIARESFGCELALLIILQCGVEIVFRFFAGPFIVLSHLDLTLIGAAFSCDYDPFTDLACLQPQYTFSIAYSPASNIVFHYRSYPSYPPQLAFAWQVAQTYVWPVIRIAADTTISYTVGAVQYVNNGFWTYVNHLNTIAPNYHLCWIPDPSIRLGGGTGVTTSPPTT